ncbi:hypothetical protein HanRHA438_Chr15g0706001 [Helianthus annuus]|nr:hypothetical protein HanRHA438_Chr15g0706001 [Helianthus annuus]
MVADPAVKKTCDAGGLEQCNGRRLDSGLLPHSCGARKSTEWITLAVDDWFLLLICNVALFFG